MHSRERHPFAPSRRGLAGMLAAGAALALPVAATATAVTAPADPDAALIALGRELEAAWADERTTVAAYSEDDLTDEMLDAVCGRTSAVVGRIEALTATTLVGLKVKLRALEWCMTGDPLDVPNLFGRKEASTDYRLTVAILNDLSAIG